MRQQICGLAMGTLVLAPALAVGQGRWVVPRCDIKPGHYLVNSGVLYLKNAAETRFDEQREKDLRDAGRTLIQAVTSGNQDKNPAAWYYLGRYFVVRNDAPGADSAFRKAEALLPACREDIQFWRRNAMWVPTFNAGVAALTAQNYDSAIASFRRAIEMYDAEPQGYTSLATAFFNAGRPDSAAKYFRLGVQAASDPKYANEKKDAIFNLGNAFYAGQRYDSAAAAYAEYLRLVPDDPQALARLGDVLTAAGQKDSAMSVYRQIIAHADSVDPMSLFSAGVSIYNAAPSSPDTAALGETCRTERRGGRTLSAVQRRGIAAGCDSVTRQAMRARDVAAADNYRLAAQAFESGLARNPHSRDGLFNLANSYLALREPDKMLAVGQRLMRVDPMSRGSLRLVAQAWQLKGKGDSALYYVTQADSLLPFDVAIGSFSPGEQNATLSGLMTNYHSRPSAPATVVFEFLSAGGEVVATKSVDVPAIPGSGNHPFQVDATGAGIAAWRYRKG
ncbi:MAG: tetratricopeptide repeat protein [Gemmatimonadales bacterium]